MAGNYSIIQRLGLDTKDYEAGLAHAQRKSKSWAFRLGGLMGNPFAGLSAQLAGLASIAVFTKLAKDAVQFGSAITDMAAATRTGVEELQALQFAAREAGASDEQLRQALIKTTTAAEEAARGQEEYRRRFAALNINVEEFLKQPTERRLEMLGKAYINAGQSGEAYNALVRILGEESGPKLIEVLQRLGRDGFDVVADSAREAGAVISKLDAQRLDALSDTFENWKVIALAAISEVVLKVEEVVRFWANVGLNSADQQLKDARQRAIAELQNEGAIPRSGRAQNSTENRAKIEQRTQEILNDITRKGIETRKQAQVAATQFEAQQRVAAAENVAKIIADAEQKVRLERESTLAQLAEVTAQKDAALAIANDEARTEKERENAARDAAKLIAEASRLQKKVDDEKQDALEKQLEILDQQLDTQRQINQQARDEARERARSQDRFRDVTRLSLSEIANAPRGEGFGSGARSKAQRVIRLEERATRARTRGQDELADKLQGQASDIRQKIPGLQSSDRDLGKVAGDQLKQLEDINKKLEGIASKVDAA